MKDLGRAPSLNEQRLQLLRSNRAPLRKKLSDVLDVRW